MLPPDEWQVLTVSADARRSSAASRPCPRTPSPCESTFTHQPGVYPVTAPEQQIRQMNHVIRVLQIVFLALALVLLLSATVLILNTIRMAIFARRREVSVMKLVGATNWFIRIPYITEGFIQGLLGSAVAIGAVTALHIWYPLHNEFDSSTSALLGHQPRRADRRRRDRLGRLGDRDPPLPRRLVVRLVEVERERVHAVAQPRGRRSVVEDVAQVPTALRTEDLGSPARTASRSVRSTMVPGSHASKLGHPHPESNFCALVKRC